MSGRISPILSIPTTTSTPSIQPQLSPPEMVGTSNSEQHELLQKFAALQKTLINQRDQIIWLQSKLTRFELEESTGGVEASFQGMDIPDMEEFGESLQTAMGDIRAKGEANAVLIQQHELIRERLIIKNQANESSVNELEVEKQANTELRQQHEVIRGKLLAKHQENVSLGQMLEASKQALEEFEGKFQHFKSVPNDFFLSDERWDNGVHRKFTAFFLPIKFADVCTEGKLIKLGNGEVREIVGTEKVGGKYLNVYLKGERLLFSKVGRANSYFLI